MPKTTHRLTIHMSPQYREFLDRLREAGRWRNDSEMMEVAVSYLAECHDLEAPPRANPLGWNERPGKKSEGKG